MIILVGGAIAAGKSTVAHAAATELRRRGRPAAAIDLDLVYEMLAGRDAVKSDADVWRRARLAAAALARHLVESGGDAIVEGDIGDPRAWPPARVIWLQVPLDVALERVAADPTRGRSRDPAFLTRHYAEAPPAPATATVFDTSVTPLAEIVATAAGT